MTRQKNALRGHFVAPYNNGTEPTGESTWLELAKWITDVSGDKDEKTEDQAFYDGDGTEETSVISVKGAYTFEGTYDPADPAQALIAAMKYKTGDERKVWHKVVQSDKKKQFVGIATVSDIKAGSGAAADYEAFGCKISYNATPKETGIG